MENSLIEVLKKYNLKIATAESCTGGLIASKLVNVSGASEVFEYGFITYSNAAKNNILEIDNIIIEQYTAVSREVAKEMAIGCAKKANSDVALSVTGYAGPYDSVDEPKGLVFIGCYYKGDVTVNELQLEGNRQEIRENAAIFAIDLAIKTIIANIK